MPISNLNKKRGGLFLATCALVVSAGFLFFSEAKSVSAAPGDSVDLSADSNTCSCYNVSSLTDNGFTMSTTATSDAECAQKCSTHGGYYRYGKISHLIPLVSQSESCFSIKAPISSLFVCLLVGVLHFFGWILSVAAAIFGWAADANNLVKVINGQNIYDAWKIVRDLLNMAFILTLLYTAFTIIFQVDSTNKKIILTVVLMALLVNFSFPIVRFIIDVANSLMYTIFQSLFYGVTNPSDIFNGITNSTQLASILHPTGSPDFAQLIASIVFVAILSITFLMMAILFVIRIVILAILIIFSPVAFVGAAVPGMKSLSSKWWDNLFKYSFFGPAMAFMLYVALTVMKSATMAGQNLTSLSSESGSTVIQGMATFAIPIVILWIGMGIAQSMGIAGAALAQKYATKAFKAVAMAPVKAGQWGLKKSGVPGGIKKGWEDTRKSGKIFGFDNKLTQFALKDKQPEREAQIAGGFTSGQKGWNDAIKNKKAEEFRKKYKEEADKYDRSNATGATGLVKNILDANLDHADMTVRNKEAMKVAAMLHNLKTDPVKKDEFDIEMRSEIVKNPAHITAMAGKSDQEKEAYIKKAMNKEWKLLNDKGAQAHEVATTGSHTGAAKTSADAATKVW